MPVNVLYMLISTVRVRGCICSLELSLTDREELMLLGYTINQSTTPHVAERAGAKCMTDG